MGKNHYFNGGGSPGTWLFPVTVVLMGVAMTSCGHLRVASEALRLVLIDADSYRLQQAMKKAQTFGTCLFFLGRGGTFRMVLGGMVLGCPAGT